MGPVRVDLQPALDLEEMSKLQQKCREIVPEVKRRASPVGMGLAGRFMSMNGLCPPQVVGLGDLWITWWVKLNDVSNSDCLTSAGLSRHSGCLFLFICGVPSGYICSYNTAFRGLCPSSHRWDLHRGQKVWTLAALLARHILILLSWEDGSSTASSPPPSKVLLKSPLCWLCVCVLVCVITLLATSYPCCRNVLSSDAAQICRLSSFSTGQMDNLIWLYIFKASSLNCGMWTETLEINLQNLSMFNKDGTLRYVFRSLHETCILCGKTAFQR